MTDVKGAHEITEQTLAQLCTTLGCAGAVVVLVDFDGQAVIMNEIHATEIAAQTIQKAIAAIIKELDIDVDKLEVEEVTVSAGPQIVH